MIRELPPIILKGKQLRKYRYYKRKYPVSSEFLKSNWENSKRFILYALTPRCVLRNYAWRKHNHVVIKKRARLLLFDPRLKRMIKRRKANVKQWSACCVRYYKKNGYIKEFEETELYGEELSKQMKQQLELLKSGKRGLSLIEENVNKTAELCMRDGGEKRKEDKEGITTDHKKDENILPEIKEAPPLEPRVIDEKKEENVLPDTKETSLLEPSIEMTTLQEPKTMEVEPPKVAVIVPMEKSIEKSPEKSAGGSKFLDMLMNKVRVKNFAKESNFSKPTSDLPNSDYNVIVNEHNTNTTTAAAAAAAAVVDSTNSEYSFHDDTSEDFVGFDDSAHQPGMLQTPLVPQSCKTLEGNAAFYSDSLEAYMKKNNLREDRERLLEPMYQDGRVTAHSMPPHMDMPAVPDSLQRLRTVADRRHYLQRSKNQKMAIINNEANVYRELQRKQRQRKVKIAAMQHLQSAGTQMPFTRQGWQAASYVATEHDKYYYQVMRIDGEMVRLPGSQGNNAQREKQPHYNQLTPLELAKLRCDNQCPDAVLQRELKVQPTRLVKVNSKLQKLNQYPLPAIFRPCPLSQKPFQKPLDDDTAALLLAGGSMAVVSMPTVQLDVKPQLGRPLDEIAKRYLQHILPHHDITREWAEFSVSTLRESPNNMRDAEQQAAKTLGGRRKSFTFVIPYLNDRNHILVRRVVDRSEPLDESFSTASPPEKLEEFEFRKALPETPDPVTLACADMINDMINTVAISCSENSFISQDPDAANASCTTDVNHANEESAASKAEKAKAKQQQLQQQQKRPNKQMRLAKELRRLNATIIDAAAIAKDANKPCVKEHCQLGCLCESLTGELPAREHCGQADCVLECHCTGAELTRIMRVETDGRGLSNEDAFNLRRQATARLAKMEKDFTSTLVLTDNETLLINETQCDKKRRCTKAPKRYEDFDDSIEDEEGQPTTRSSKVPPKREVSVKNTRSSLVQSEPRCVRDTDFVQLKHCSVSLRRLPDVANLATFCMTHQLYKCFCGGLAVDGKPIIIEKEQSETIIPHYVPELATRAHYSFERAQEEPTVQQQQQQSQQSKKRRKEKQPPPQQMKILNSMAPMLPVVREQPKPKLLKLAPKPLPPPSISAPPNNIIPNRAVELDIIYNYYRSSGSNCRRAVPVPSGTYLQLNRKRANGRRLDATRAETKQKQDLLKKRVFNGIRYYRAELDQQRRMEGLLLQTVADPVEPSVIVVRDDSDESEPGPKVEVQPPKRKRQLLLPQTPALPVESVQSPEEPKEKKHKPQPTPQTSQPQLDIQMPKISSCFSLNPTSAAMMDFGETAGFSSIITSPSSSSTSLAAASIDESSSLGQTFRANYNDVIQKMNTHVSKKMQDIDLALQRESKIIPAPNEEILCIIKWTNFLAAFESEYVFIWDVQMKSHSFLAATITNMMPAVCGAIAVVNTRFAPDPSTLPLMARMLLENKRNENTGRLAVVMQGRKQYWLVKGFLRYMEGNSCTKPTPQTHPILTKKINVLCTLMVKQRMREVNRKAALGETPASITSPPTAGLLAPAIPPTPAEADAAVAIETAVPLDDMPALDTTPPPSTAAVAATAPAVVPAMDAAQSKDTCLNIRSNIEFRKVFQADVGELQIPELHEYDHRWVVLNLFDDFSHIFVPAFRDMLSLDRIHNVVRVAHESNKVVKLQFFQDAPYDAFVTPSSRRKIYFGPLRLDMQPPVLVLLQSVDGKMMLREVYQREHNIPVQRDKRTMAFWVLQINNQVHFEIDLGGGKSENQQQLPSAKETKEGLKEEQQELEVFRAETDNVNDEDDDDDCMIIDDDDEQAEEKQDALQQPQKQHQQRINFTIQTTPNNGSLKITSATAGDAAVATPPPGSFVPFIANVPAIGSTAPATQFLTPQVQLTQTSSTNSSSSNSNKKTSTTNATTTSAVCSETPVRPPPAKISRISVQRCSSGAGATKDVPAPKINESLQQLLCGGNGNVKIGTGSTGVTITKVNAKDATPTPAIEPIRIGSKRKSQGEPGGAGAKAPIVRKQKGTTISIVNMPVLQVQSQPEKLPTDRKSLPAAKTSLPTANTVEPRQSLPAATSIIKSSTTPEAATTGKVRDGFLMAKDLPQIRCRHMDGKFMVKMPETGVLSFKNQTTAVAYLNRVLTRNPDFKPFLPADWKFLPFETHKIPKATSQQQHAIKPAKSLAAANPSTTPIVIED